MIVTVNLINPPQSVVHSEVKRTFIDGDFFCIDEPDGLYKYQRSNIWLVVEKEETEQKEEKETE
jgi:hypothetical protein